MAAHTCNPSTWKEAKAELPQVGDHFGLHSESQNGLGYIQNETVSKKRKQNPKYSC